MTEVSSPTRGVSRRGFFQWIMTGLLLGVSVVAANVLVRYLMPPPKIKKAKKLSIPSNQIPPGSSMTVDYKGSPVIVVHSGGEFVAFSAICTHLGCLVKWSREDKIFKCPCHAGHFDITGKVLSGPPPEPLHRVRIDLRNDEIIFP